MRPLWLMRGCLPSCAMGVASAEMGGSMMWVVPRKLSTCMESWCMVRCVGSACAYASFICNTCASLAGKQKGYAESVASSGKAAWLTWGGTPSRRQLPCRMTPSFSRSHSTCPVGSHDKLSGVGLNQ